MTESGKAPLKGRVRVVISGLKGRRMGAQRRGRVTAMAKARHQWGQPLRRLLAAGGGARGGAPSIPSSTRSEPLVMDAVCGHLGLRYNLFLENGLVVGIGLAIFGGSGASVQEARRSVGGSCSNAGGWKWRYFY